MKSPSFTANRCFLLLLMCWLGSLVVAPIAHAVTLHGRVEQDARPPAPPGVLRVVDERDQRPLADVRLESYPSGTQRRSNTEGLLSIADLPAPSAQHRLLLSKPGYQAQTLSYTRPVPPGETWQLALRPLANGLTLHPGALRLGDGAYSALSASAQRLDSEFVTQPPHPRIELTFSLPPHASGKAVTLYSAGLIGLDTLAAQRAGQSKAPVSGSPATVWLNEERIAQLELNAPTWQTSLPSAQLKYPGPNHLRIEAGGHAKASGHYDVDDFAMLQLWLRW